VATLGRNWSGLKVLGLALALTNLALWFGVVWLRNSFDALAGRLHSPYRPGVFFGVQELLVYYDPWLARGVFPIVYMLGFVAIGFLYQPTKEPESRDPISFALVILLLFFETVWLFLIAFALFCRGPDWNFYWPWEPWNPKVVPMNPANFSGIFWWHLAGHRVPQAPWFVREAPGLLLVVGYFSLGLLVARSLSRGVGRTAVTCFSLLFMLFGLLPLTLRMILSQDVANFYLVLLLFLPVPTLIVGASYLLFRLLRARELSEMSGGPMACWRWDLLVLLVQLAALVPVKVLLFWAFDMKYFISLPEYAVNV